MTTPLAELVSRHDWASTSLGARDRWSPELQTVVQLLLTSSFPMILLWGPELIQIYNDGYAVILGPRHPAALGEPTRAIWPEVWHINEPIYAAVWRGETLSFENQLYPVTRYGYQEEAYFTLCYSPVWRAVGAGRQPGTGHTAGVAGALDGATGVDGVFITVTETTAQVLAERRIALLQHLNADLAGAMTEQAVREVLRGLVDSGPPDLPFAELYLEDDPLPPETRQALMSGRLLRLPQGEAIPLTLGGDQGKGDQEKEGGRERKSGQDAEGGALGVLVVGFGPQARLDPALWEFFYMTALQLSAVLRRLHAQQEAQRHSAELAARNMALEAFQELTHDSSVATSETELVGRAQTLLYQQLPLSLAAYFERQDGRWYARSVLGDAAAGDGDLPLAEALRIARSGGLPEHAATRLQLPAETGETLYRDAEVRDGDQPGRRQPTAMLPLRAAPGQPVRGIFGLVRSGPGSWSSSERALIEAVGNCLHAALQRLYGVQQLAQRSLELERQTEALTLANAELEAFSYSVSHDLRTPVRHVLGFSDLALRAVRAGQRDVAERHVAVVRGAAERMNSLLDAMLLLSRNSQQGLRLERVSLRQLTDQARHDAAAEFPGVRVIWDVGELPEVRGDAALLQQVMTNLLANAVKYSGTREVVRVSVRATVQGDAGEGSDSGMWRVEVADNGEGFDPRYAHKLFGVFQRLHQASKYPGTGVGLATVKRIVTRHGGAVFAEGRPGEGATFSFTLPGG